jgi:hypothetical protein
MPRRSRNASASIGFGGIGHGATLVETTALAESKHPVRIEALEQTKSPIWICVRCRRRRLWTQWHAIHTRPTKRKVESVCALARSVAEAAQARHQDIQEDSDRPIRCQALQCDPHSLHRWGCPGSALHIPLASTASRRGLVPEGRRR